MTPLLTILLAASTTASTTTLAGGEAGPRRIGNHSPAFPVPTNALGFYMNYTGFTYTNAARTDGTRTYHEGIGPKVLDMIANADTHIILSVFLFDNFYSEAPVDRDIVGVLTKALLARRTARPDIHIALILDPSHAAYGQRISPAERTLRAHGVDVFYSDLLSDLKKASALGVRETLGGAGRLVDTLTFNLWGNTSGAILNAIKLPKRFDDEYLSLESAYNASLMKANHRKLLVCDVHGADWDALVATANPHNASAYHVNTAISVRGEPARYIYHVLREDMQHSAGLGKRFAHWHDDADRTYRHSLMTTRFPELPPGPTADVDPSPRAASPATATVRFVTESAIRDAVISLLNGVEPADEVRIQMFYLSFQPVLDALLAASRRVDLPIRLLLDANKDSFNREKDGTPNRQVARYLLREAQATGGKLEIRWYATHGEQNHVKTMSIRNRLTGRTRFTTGSANWTGRNLDGVNMESNLVAEDAPPINAGFDTLFDRFWTNADGVEYSLDYEVFREAASDAKWRRGEKPWYLSSF
ncbi:MAG: hypothetical protein K8T26_14760 [Lentisphaerae bacterium]|nr:hypothetical protein [Lentisphaerota bacterium]